MFSFHENVFNLLNDVNDTYDAELRHQYKSGDLKYFENFHEINVEYYVFKNTILF